MLSAIQSVILIVLIKNIHFYQLILYIVFIAISHVNKMSDVDQASYSQKADSYSSDSEAEERLEEYPDTVPSDHSNSDEGEYNQDEQLNPYEEQAFKIIEDQNIINKLKQEQQIRILPKEQRSTLDCITKYQYTKVISVRAQQIALGSPLYINIPFQDLKDLGAIGIAQKQFQMKKIPFIIRRTHPNGDCEDWALIQLQNKNR